MPFMNEQHIARLEAQLERLVEGAFTQLFGKQIRAQDIALQLARALEDESQPAHGGDSRPLAPDTYYIILSPRIQEQLLKNQPGLTQTLSKHLVELAAHAGYRLNAQPVIHVSADAKLDHNDLIVRAEHSDQRDSNTEAMQRVEIPVQSTPHNAQLILNGEKTIQLEASLITLGRERDNMIVLDDPFASRYHAQLRQRGGSFLLFDTNSRSGTYVNDVQVKEHRLQPGDVIRIGKTHMIYLDDDPLHDSQAGLNATSEMPPPELE
jgi:hypothetical protein